MPFSFLNRFRTQPAAAPQMQANIKPPSLKEIGVMRSRLYLGSDFTYYNPDELLANKGEGIYTRMLKDDQVKAVYRFKQNAITSRDYYFDIETDPETDEENKDHVEMADFFMAAIKNISGSWSDKLIEILSAFKSGFSVCEKIYAPFQWQDKAYWGLQDIKLRPAQTFNNGGFVVDEHGRLLAIKQVGIGTEEIELPIDKIVHFVYQPDIDRYYGESDLKAAHRAWWSKDIAIKFQNIHLERHAHGFVWAKVTEGNLTTTQKDALQDALDNITLNTAMQVPYNVELDTVQPLRTDAYDKAIIQYNSAIARSMLVPNLLGLSEQGPHGSRALGDTQFQGFLWVLNAIDAQLCEVLNEQIFRQLSLWNFGTEDFPRYCTQPLSQSEQLELMKGWAELVSKGAVQRSDSDEDFIRKTLGMPEKSEPDPDEMPVEMPDNQQWINGQPDSEFILQQFKDKPWLKRVDFALMERRWNNADASISHKLTDITAQIKDDLFKQVEKIGGDRSWGNVDPKEIQAVQIPKTRMADLRKTMQRTLIDIFNEAYDQAAKELPKRVFRRIGIGMDKTQAERFINSRMMALAQKYGDAIVEAVDYVLQNAIRYDKSLRETMLDLDKAISKFLATTGEAPLPAFRLENIARTESSKAINEARASLFGDPALNGFVQAYEYSAIMDSRTTEICAHLNGKILRDFSHYQPPNHFQCRSILIPITQVDEWNGKEIVPSSKIQPQEGFG